uniref:Uncharacterized protein n=1 Tax=Romanomermis culicivorax TaxID=13658 RepID=A0A915K0V2_ROMCU
MTKFGIRELEETSVPRADVCMYGHIKFEKPVSKYPKSFAPANLKLGIYLNDVMLHLSRNGRCSGQNFGKRNPTTGQKSISIILKWSKRVVIKDSVSRNTNERSKNFEITGKHLKTQKKWNDVVLQLGISLLHAI